MSSLNQYVKQIKEDNKRIDALKKKVQELEKIRIFSAEEYQKVYNDLLQIKNVLQSEQKEFSELKKGNAALSKDNQAKQKLCDDLKVQIEDKVCKIKELTPVRKPGEKFVLSELPWPRDALKPHISEETINFHYGKHHTGYVNKLNNALEKEDAQKFGGLGLEQIIKNEDAKKMSKLWNCAAQNWNHSFYWQSMSPNGGGEPSGAIKKKIDEDFGSFEKFKASFTAAASGHFGSGWAWLLLKDDKLVIGATHNAGCPISTDLGKPILTCDVWEHAYYVDYRNNRGAYINAWWKLINWDFANTNLESTQEATNSEKKVENKQEPGASSVTEAFSLPSLPWERDALSPNISKETIDFHYGKHHAGYVKKLNIALGKEDAKSLKGLTLEELIKKAPKGKLWNCAAQHWNHSFYWKSMSPNAGGNPTGAIGKKIDEDFGSFEKFKTAFTTAAAGQFGSGWAWLLLKDDKLIVAQTGDAGCPISSEQGKPILTCDVWEHAYYVDYRNNRGEYLKNWWNLVNWKFANENLGTPVENKETKLKENKSNQPKAGKKDNKKKKSKSKKAGKKKSKSKKGKKGKKGKNSKK